MKIIQLTQGYVTLVDDEDYESLSQFKWRVLLHKCNRYAVRSVWGKGTNGTVYMHRQILGCKGKQCTDHISGSGLDNRRANLRLATRAENQRNMKLYKDSTTKFKGVDFRREINRFRARIVVDGKEKYLGDFKTAEVAHAAYCAAAVQHFGQFARFN